MAKRVTKAELRALELAVKMAEFHRIRAIETKVWKLQRLRDIDNDDLMVLMHAAKLPGSTVLPSDEELNAEIEAKIAATPNLHVECQWNVREYGRLTYSNSDLTCCAGCGDPLLCAGVNRKHAYRELNQLECRAQNLYHGGNCYHVQECTVCGRNSAYDSSD